MDPTEFMATPTSFNRYRVAREILTKALMEVGGEVMAQAMSKGQLEELEKTDPTAAKTSSLLSAMFGKVDQLSEPWHKYVAIGQVMLELKELEEKLDDEEPKVEEKEA